MNAPAYRLLDIGPGQTREIADDVSRLHAGLLSHSPVVLLGDLFMRRFYYWRLPLENRIFGSVAYIDDQPAGFIVSTDDAGGFMDKALKKHALYLAGLFAVSLLRRPAGIVGLWESYQINRNLPPAGDMQATGEILSLGIMPEYRKRKFVKQTGLRLSHDLLAQAMQQAAARGCRRLRSLVDQDNTEARLFYRGLEWSLGEDDVPGWKQPVVEYYVDLPRADDTVSGATL